MHSGKAIFPWVTIWQNGLCICRYHFCPLPAIQDHPRPISDVDKSKHRVCNIKCATTHLRSTMSRLERDQNTTWHQACTLAQRHSFADVYSQAAHDWSEDRQGQLTQHKQQMTSQLAASATTLAHNKERLQNARKSLLDEIVAVQRLQAQVAAVEANQALMQAHIDNAMRLSDVGIADAKDLVEAHRRFICHEVFCCGPEVPEAVEHLVKQGIVSADVPHPKQPRFWAAAHSASPSSQLS